MTKSHMEERFVTYVSGKEKCNCCGRFIPKDIKRISIYNSGRYGGATVRVCELCIYNLSQLVNKENLKKWRMKLFVEEV